MKFLLKIVENENIVALIGKRDDMYIILESDVMGKTIEGRNWYEEYGFSIDNFEIVMNKFINVYGLEVVPLGDITIEESFYCS